MENQSATNQDVAVVNNTPTEVSFGNTKEFEHSQRVAKMLAAASLIPKEYQNNIPNTMIALEMANRIGSSPLMVMQNLYVVHGKPAWSGSFVIAALNACGRFTPLRFDIQGTGDNMSCYAYANDRKTGDKLKGTTVTIAMAKAEGWYGKSGSKWQTMPEQMIQYRSGTFFGRLYAPDILMGMPSADEVEDYTLMSTSQQDGYIESLLSTSTLDDKQRRGIEWKVSNGITQGEAIKIIEDLRLNQLHPSDLPNISAGAAQLKVGEIIGQ